MPYIYVYEYMNMRMRFQIYSFQLYWTNSIGPFVVPSEQIPKVQKLTIGKHPHASSLHSYTIEGILLCNIEIAYLLPLSLTISSKICPYFCHSHLSVSQFSRCAVMIVKPFLASPAFCLLRSVPLCFSWRYLSLFIHGQMFKGQKAFLQGNCFIDVRASVENSDVINVGVGGIVVTSQFEVCFFLTR